MTVLSPTERTLLNFMRSKGYDVDIAIEDMWTAILGPAPDPGHFAARFRSKQQYIGAFVSRVNRKQRDYEIVPGELKRTYRVQFKTKE